MYNTNNNEWTLVEFWNQHLERGSYWDQLNVQYKSTVEKDLKMKRTCKIF